MKKLLLSLLIGCALTAILYWYCEQPSNGSGWIVMAFVVPLQIIAMVITKNDDLGEMVFYGLLVIWFSFGGYLIVACLDWARKRLRRKP